MKKLLIIAAIGYMTISGQLSAMNKDGSIPYEKNQSLRQHRDRLIDESERVKARDRAQLAEAEAETKRQQQERDRKKALGYKY